MMSDYLVYIFAAWCLFGLVLLAPSYAEATFYMLKKDLNNVPDRSKRSVFEFRIAKKKLDGQFGTHFSALFITCIMFGLYAKDSLLWPVVLLKK
ncbi:hypothetical protein VPHK120G1_0036 [Vibrio phage K120 g1]